MAWEIAIVGALLGVSAILIYLASSLEEPPLKYLFFFIALFTLLITLNTSTIIVDSAGINQTLYPVNKNINTSYYTLLYSSIFTFAFFIIMFIKNLLIQKKEREMGEIE